MRSINCKLLFPAVLAAICTSMLSAQSTDEEFCVITIKGQNRNRIVAGSIATECADVFFPVQWHDPPWGNWGVSSNYSSTLTDTDQFRGWKHKDGPTTKLQWNSCTVTAAFAPPNSEYYNSDDSRYQTSDATVTHGMYSFRSSVSCPDSEDYYADPPAGCSSFSGFTAMETENYMTIYELDFLDGDDLIETLYFPGTSVTLTSCSHDGCPETDLALDRNDNFHFFNCVE